MAQVAWTAGYLHGVGKATIARALARKRALENIQYRRAAHEVARALDRNRKRILDSST
jgi:broad-specificity NMP kinase